MKGKGTAKIRMIFENAHVVFGNGVWEEMLVEQFFVKRNQRGQKRAKERAGHCDKTLGN